MKEERSSFLTLIKAFQPGFRFCRSGLHSFPSALLQVVQKLAAGGGALAFGRQASDCGWVNPKHEEAPDKPALMPLLQC